MLHDYFLFPWKGTEVYNAIGMSPSMANLTTEGPPYAFNFTALPLDLQHVMIQFFTIVPDGVVNPGREKHEP